MSIPEPLARIFEVYCHVHATNLGQLADDCKRKDWSYSSPELFERQLRDVLLNRTITISEYDEITCEEFDTLDDLYDWLKTVWDDTIKSPL